MPMFLVCFGLYFANYKSWQVEICKSVPPEKNIVLLFWGFVGVVFWS